MTEQPIGEQIRALRRARRLTLQQVAGQSGLSVSFLSQMERNRSGVTLTSLVSISRALGVPLHELVPQPPQAPSPDTHHGARPEYRVEMVSLRYERLSSSFQGSRLHALKIGVPAGFSSGIESHEGEELLYVLSGTLEYLVDRVTYRLEAGDSVHIDSRRPHQIANRGPAPAELLWTSTLPVFDDEVPAAAATPPSL